MLVVGENSYVTLEEAEQIMGSSFISTDTAYQKWQTLPDSDKEVILMNSCRDINNLKFEGRRRNVGQKLEFPRTSDVVAGIGYRLFISQFVDNGLYGNGVGDGGLSLVKTAQVINAVYASVFNEQVYSVIGAGIQGLSSKKAGPIAETYNRNTQEMKDAQNGIYTTKVYSILTPWLSSVRMAY